MGEIQTKKPPETGGRFTGCDARLILKIDQQGLAVVGWPDIFTVLAAANMFIVKVEFHNFNTRAIQTIGLAAIGNNRTHHTRNSVNYDVVIAREEAIPNSEKQATLTQIMETPLRSTKLEGFDRENREVWELITRALIKAFPEALD